MSANNDVAVEVALGSGKCSRCRGLIQAGSRYIRAGNGLFYHDKCPTTAAAMTEPMHSVTPPDRLRDVRIEDGRRLFINDEFVVERPMSSYEAGVEISREAIAEWRAGRAPDLRAAIYSALRRDPARALTYHTGG